MYRKLHEKNSVAFAIYRFVRNNIGLREYPIYVFALFFLKYISDVNLDVLSIKDSNAQKKNNIKHILFSVPTVEFTFSDGSKNKLPADFYTLYTNRDAQNLNEIFNLVFQEIEKHNKELLGGLFQELDFSNENIFGKSDERNLFLKELLEIFYKQELRPSIVDATTVRQNFTRLIELFAARGYGRSSEHDFFTPPQLSRLIVQLVEPKAGDSVCDPVCGTGGFLTQAAEFIESGKTKLFGQEINRTAWSLARMNMLLHNIDDARIEWGDTLDNPLLIKESKNQKNKLMQFNIVVASPPFISGRRQGREHREKIEQDVYKRFWRGVSFRYPSEWTFISHALETALKKRGRVAVLASHGVLFRHGQEKTIRQKVIEENLLDAVIGLPKNLLPQTAIPLVVLLFDRSREKGGAREKNKDILFIDASNEFIANRMQNVLSNEHIEKIVKTYKSRKKEKTFSSLAELKIIKKNDYDLNIQNYVNSFEEETIDLKILQEEIQTLENELKNVQEQLGEKLKELE